MQLSAVDLLAISEEISQQYAPDTKIQEPEVVLMPVDPYHLQAFWNLGERQIREIKPYAGKDLVLRIYWQPEDSDDIATTKLWFDVAVKNIRHQLKVRLPIDQTTYSAALGRLHANHRFDEIVRSNSIQVPRGRMLPAQAEHFDSDSGAGGSMQSVSNFSTIVGEPQAFNETNIAATISQTLQEKGFAQNIEKFFPIENQSNAITAFAVKNPSGQNRLH